MHETSCSCWFISVKKQRQKFHTSVACFVCEVSHFSLPKSSIKVCNISKKPCTYSMIFFMKVLVVLASSIRTSTDLTNESSNSHIKSSKRRQKLH
jgi:hypothetical protein